MVEILINKKVAELEHGAQQKLLLASFEKVGIFIRIFPLPSVKI
ncbi:MAG: hypothetical protein OP8BY_2255 [Candidatus Saccharicenans subterraneus]|uniref:Uncharacterized protein n=1 Tax=Candidatus Saccharicenans subterraneus TaxID=2508984 RepID=A0A3E2BMJ5_9BACT|nr:MAG: hypothetical protein OP8BY_2255 [Candidatus Saccharicenans subterraneum]